MSRMHGTHPFVLPREQIGKRLHVLLILLHLRGDEPKQGIEGQFPTRLQGHAGTAMMPVVSLRSTPCS